MGRPATLRINILANAKKAVAATREVESGFGKMAKRAKFAAGVAAAAVAGIAAGAVVAVKAAGEEQLAQAKLAQALRNATGAKRSDIAAAEAWIDTAKFQSLTSDDDLRPALARLAEVTGSVTDAQTILKAAMDVAAATGKPLSSVVGAVSKAYAGNLTSLNKLAPGLDTTNVKQGDAAALAKTLAARFGGADRAASETAEGGLQDFQDVMGDLTETLGDELLPYLEDFTDWVRSPDGKKTIEDLTGAVETLGDAISAIVGFLGEAADKWKSFDDAVRDFTSPEWEGAGRRFFEDLWRDMNPGGVMPRSSSVARSGVTVNVTGALDPVATAAQVRRVLATDARRRGV